MGHDSEIAEVGRALKQMSTERRQKRAEKWEDGGKDSFAEFLRVNYDAGLICHTVHHYSFTIRGEIYDYWPTNNGVRNRRSKGPARRIPFEGLESHFLKLYPMPKMSGDV